MHLYLKQFENQTWFQSLFATSQIDGTLNKKVPDHKQSIFEETFFKIKEPENVDFKKDLFHKGGFVDDDLHFVTANSELVQVMDSLGIKISAEFSQEAFDKSKICILENPSDDFMKNMVTEEFLDDTILCLVLDGVNVKNEVLINSKSAHDSEILDLRPPQSYTIFGPL